MKKQSKLLCMLCSIAILCSCAACGSKTPVSSTQDVSSVDVASVSDVEETSNVPSDETSFVGTSSDAGTQSSTTSSKKTGTSSTAAWGERDQTNNSTTYPKVIDMKGATLVLGVKNEKDYGGGKLGESEEGDKWIAWRKNFEKTYNCKLKNVAVSNYTLYDSLATKLMSGEKVADVITMQLFDVEAFRHAGLLQSLQSIPNLNLNHSAIVQDMVNNFTFNGKSYLYFAANNVFEVYGLYFNKDMIKELKLTDPYALVKQKKWTWSAFSEMCEAAYKDNGNNKIDNADRFGSYIGADLPIGALRVSGIQVISYNNGKFNYAFNNSKTLSYLTQIKNTINNGKMVMSTKNITNTRAEAKFVKKELLFCVQDSHILENKDHQFWDIDFNYGFLPVPTFEEGMSYSNTCATWLGGLCVPKNTKQNLYIGYLLNSISDMKASLAETDKKTQLRYFGGDKETYEIYKSYDRVFKQDLYCWQTQFKDLYKLQLEETLYDTGVTAKTIIEKIDTPMKNAVKDYYAKDPDLMD